MPSTCEDCGERVYGGWCTWCHEEVYIAQQYDDEGEPVPDLIMEKIAEFEPKAGEKSRKDLAA